MKHKLIFIALFLFALISLSSVGAADSQIGDNVIMESDTSQEMVTESDSINGDIIEDSIEDSIESPASNSIETSDSEPILTEETGNFTALETEISECAEDEFQLTRDYAYSENDAIIAEGMYIRRSNFVLDGQNHTLDGSGSVRIFAVTGNNVTLKNINFINGNNTNCAGAIYFTQNSTIINCTFTNCSAGVDSGAVHSNGYIRIINSSFISNKLYGYGQEVFGGVAKLTSGLIENCQFISNNHTIQLHNLRGGALFFNEMGTVISSNFTGNQGGFGAGIYFNSSSRIENCSFIDNWAYGFTGQNGLGGAAFYNNTNIKGIVIGSYFRNNTVNDGTAINSLYSQGDIGVYNCSFDPHPLTNNQIQSYYGQIDFDDNSFWYLDYLIRNTQGNEFKLNHDYSYHPESDFGFENGISLNKSNFTIDGQGYSIDGVGLARHFNIISENVTLKNINFINGKTNLYGGSIITDDYTRISTCNFTNNSGVSGGAVYFKDDGTVESCNFDDNTANNGGALYFLANGNVTDCHFNSNAGIIGRAIYFVKEGSVIYSTFDIHPAHDKYVIYSARGEYAFHDGSFWSLSKIINSTPNELILDYDYAYNPEIDSDLANGILINKDFFIINGQGHSIDGSGLARIFNFTGETLELKNINFVNGKADKGGAVYSNSDLTSSYCNFTNNSASYGGAIYCEGSFEAYCSNFKSNNASLEGGALYCKGESSAINCEFKYNIAEDGWSIASEGNLLLKHIIFENNPEEYSKTLLIKNGANLTAEDVIPEEIFPNDFSRINELINQAQHNTVELQRNYRFDPNTDSDLVNGIVISQDNFIFDGQGFTIDGANLARIFHITGNNVTLINLNLINGRSTSDGGAVYFNKDGKVDSCNFTDNKANNGAAVYFNESGAVNNSIFNGNNASNGAVHASKNLTVSNSSFLNNIANANGGAIFTQNGTVDNSNFTNNKGHRGGAIFFGENGEVSNSNFNSNSASDAGAIYFDEGGSVEGSNFTANTASSSGGAIRVRDDLILTDIIFTDNTANDGTDNIILLGNGTITMNNVVPENIGQYRKVNIYIFNLLEFLYGETARFEVNASCGQYFKLNEGYLVLETENGNYTANVENEIAVFEIDGLELGNHGVKLTYFGPSQYTSPTRNVTIRVYQCDATLNIVEYNNLSFGEPINIKVNVKNGTAPINEGKVSIVINGETYSANVENGNATIVIEDLDLGTYTANVTFDGGLKYTKPSKEVTFTIASQNATIALDSVVNCTYGESVSISVNVKSNDTDLNNGTILLTVNDENYTAKVNEGKAVIEVPGLNAGIHTGVIKLINKYYYAEAIEVEFEVYRKAADLVLSVENITYGEKLIIKANLSSDGASVNEGNVSITIGENVYSANIANGIALIEVPGLNAGNYSETVFFNSTNYNATSGDINFTVNKSGVSLDIEANNVTQGAAVKIKVSVNGGGIQINEGNVSITIGENVYSANVEGNVGIIEIPNLPVGTYTYDILFDGGNNLLNATAPVSFVVAEEDATISIDQVNNCTAGENVTIQVMVSDSKGAGVNGTAYLSVNNESYTADVKDGIAVFTIPNLSAGEYEGTVRFDGGERYNASPVNVSFKVSPIQVSLDVIAKGITYGDTAVIIVTATANGGKVSTTINRKNYIADIVNGTAIIKVSGLNAGKYDFSISFDNGINYTKPVKNASLTVSKQKTAIAAKNKAYVINYGGKYSVTLKDAKGKVMANKKLTFYLKGKKIKTATTNTKGIARIKLTAKILKKAKAGKRKLTIKFAGDNNHIASSKAVKITVKKEKTKLKAKAKKFKRTQKTKKYVVYLKNSKSKPVKKVKLSLRLKKKTYKAKTNRKGKAVFKIKKLSKKGKFRAIVKFKGNAYYKPIKKKVKIRVK